MICLKMRQKTITGIEILSDWTLRSTLHLSGLVLFDPEAAGRIENSPSERISDESQIEKIFWYQQKRLHHPMKPWPDLENKTGLIESQKPGSSGFISQIAEISVSLPFSLWMVHSGSLMIANMAWVGSSSTTGNTPLTQVCFQWAAINCHIARFASETHVARLSSSCWDWGMLLWCLGADVSLGFNQVT